MYSTLFSHIVQRLSQLSQRIDAGHRKDRLSGQEVDHIRFHGAFRQKYALLNRACKMGPALCPGAIGFSYAGYPAEFPAADIIPADLKPLYPTLMVSHRDQNAPILPDKAPATVLGMEESRDTGKVLPF